MTKPKTSRNRYAAHNVGTPPTSFNANRGKKMQDKSGEHAQVIQTKGE